MCSQHFVCDVFCEASWGSIFIQTIWNYLNILLHFAAVYKINGLSVFLLLIGKSLARFSISLGIMFWTVSLKYAFRYENFILDAPCYSPKMETVILICYLKMTYKDTFMYQMIRRYIICIKLVDRKNQHCFCNEAQIKINKGKFLSVADIIFMAAFMAAVLMHFPRFSVTGIYIFTWD